MFEIINKKEVHCISIIYVYFYLHVFGKFSLPRDKALFLKPVSVVLCKFLRVHEFDEKYYRDFI